MADGRGGGWGSRFGEPDEECAEITVRVDEHGVVSDVVIPRDWRESVQPRELGPAIVAAANEAVAQRVAEQAAQFDLDDPQPHFVTREAPSANGDPDSPVAENLVNEVMQLFANYDSELAAYTAQLRASAKTTSHGESGGQRVTVGFTNGQVSSVDIDSTWAANARHTEIRAEVLSAFRAARPKPAAAVPLPPSIARLAELASDPHALSRQLGLSR